MEKICMLLVYFISRPLTGSLLPKCLQCEWLPCKSSKASTRKAIKDQFVWGLGLCQVHSVEEVLDALPKPDVKRDLRGGWTEGYQSPRQGSARAVTGRVLSESSLARCRNDGKVYLKEK